MATYCVHSNAPVEYALKEERNKEFICDFGLEWWVRYCFVVAWASSHILATFHGNSQAVVMKLSEVTGNDSGMTYH